MKLHRRLRKNDESQAQLLSELRDLPAPGLSKTERAQLRQEVWAELRRAAPEDQPSGAGVSKWVLGYRGAVTAFGVVAMIFVGGQVLAPTTSANTGGQVEETRVAVHSTEETRTTNNDSDGAPFETPSRDIQGITDDSAHERPTESITDQSNVATTTMTVDTITDDEAETTEAREELCRLLENLREKKAVALLIGAEPKELLRRLEEATGCREVR